MPAKKIDSEAVDVQATDPVETTDPVRATGGSPLPDPIAEPEPDMIECVMLHGRLTHEGKTYQPHEKALLPAELARGLIEAGHVAKAD